MKRKSLFVALTLGLFAAGNLEAAPPTTLVVTNAVDGAPGSLRVLMASAVSGGTITFTSSFSGLTLTLTNELVPTASPLTITATNLAGGITLQGNGTKRVLYNEFGLTLNVSGIKITGGGGQGADSFSNNRGGGVANRGTLTMDRCAIFGNSASANGGGVYNAANGTLVMTNCTISGNSANYAGGIQIDQNTTLQQCTISSNSSSYYAGGSVSGTAVLKNCTIARNTSSTQYGWLVSGGSMTMINCTVASNSVATQGGITLFNSTLLLTNSILAGNTPADWANAGGGSIAGASNIIGGNVKLGPLTDNGGATLTMALLSNSPAINAALSLPDITTDQRGKVRPQFGSPDIGAYEVTAFDTGQNIVTVGGGSWYLGAPVQGSDLSIYREVSGQTPVNIGGAASLIGQAGDGTVVVRNASGNVYSRPGSTSGSGSGWTQRTSVFAGDGATWFLGPDGSLIIYRWANTGLPANSTGSGTNLTVLYDGSIMTRANDNSTWRRIGSNAGLGSSWLQVYLATNSPALKNTTKLLNGSLQFGFTNQTGGTYSVLMSTNLALPLAQWTSIGSPTESPAGTYLFTDSTATNSARRFYRITSP